MKSTTPKNITRIIRAFCKEIDTTQEPVFVPVRPWENSKLTACHTNAPAYQKQHGGNIQYGWLIWEIPGVLLEAIFHSIWVSPAGVFIDITPTADGEETILFLPDSKRVYEHELVAAIRKPLIKAPALSKLIEDDKFLFELEKKHFKNDRIDQAAVQAELEMLGISKLRMNTSAKPWKIGTGRFCPCGSGKIYSKCCGRSYFKGDRE